MIRVRHVEGAIAITPINEPDVWVIFDLKSDHAFKEWWSRVVNKK